MRNHNLYDDIFFMKDDLYSRFDCFRFKKIDIFVKAFKIFGKSEHLIYTECLGECACVRVNA